MRGVRLKRCAEPWCGLVRARWDESQRQNVPYGCTMIREARGGAGCGTVRTCTTRHAWGGVLGGGQGRARRAKAGHQGGA